LVDIGFFVGNSLRVVQAVWVTATRALRLRQGVKNALDQTHLL